MLGTWGVHDTPVIGDRWVHDLEHGGIVVLYKLSGRLRVDVAT
jgi:hypothetical protein